MAFRIRVPGRPPATSEPGHTVFAHSAINPIDKAMVIYQALQELDTRRNRRIRFPLLEEAIGHSTSLSITNIHCGHPDRLNTISDECVLSGAIVFPPGESAGEVAGEIVATVGQAAREDEWLCDHEPVIEWLRTVTQGTEVAESHPLYQTVEKAITSVTGVRPRNYPLHTGSDIRNPMLYKGIPTLGFGPLSGDSTQIGGSDEWVDIEDYLRAVKVAASILVNWCGVG
jgi:acetylornithine deacetylase